jgi:HAE1 family hydrophobic/amphiphilic exporter-1
LKSLVRLFVARPVTTWMVALAAALFGLVALGRLDLQLLPEIRYPSLTLQTEFPNTAPVDVENLVTRPLEEAVGVVPGLRRVHSVSQAGLSQITLEFGWDTPMDYAALDVREKIDLVELPVEARPPVLLRYDPALDPVMRVDLWGDRSLTHLRVVAEEIVKKELESLQGVAAARVTGGLEEEIRVEVDEDRLVQLGIPVAAVQQALAQENIDVAGGRLRDRSAEYMVRTLSRFADLEDIGRVTVAQAQGRPVRLSEVARIVRGHRERTTITHVDGHESVQLALYKEGDANVVRLARRVHERLKQLQEELPEGMRLEVLFDQSVFVSRAIGEVRNNALLGGLLAILVLYVFLRDLRSTLVIGVAIPLSIVATFMLMYLRGVSLNVMSLGGLALGVGLLVDNSIVVLESIHRRRASGGRDPAEAAVLGTSEVGGAVTASTLTTIAVFLPVVFVVVGVAGQIFRDQALTVTFSLLVSLLVALTFTPMAVAGGRRAAAGAVDVPPTGQVRRRRRFPARAGAWLVLMLPALVITLLRALGRFLRWQLEKLLWPLTAAFAAGYPRLEAGYERLLAGALRRRGLVLGVAALVALMAGVLAVGLGRELVPPLAQGELTLSVALPEGTPLERTARSVADLEQELGRLPGVARVSADVGVSKESGRSLERRKENRAQMHLHLDRVSAPDETVTLERVREVLGARPELAYEVRRPSLLTLDSPVEVDVYGYDLDVLQETAGRVASSLRKVRGLRDVRMGTVPGAPEIQSGFDRDTLAQQGLTLSDVAETVRGKVRGTVPSRLRDRERHIDIRVQNLPEQRESRSAVRDLVVAERGGVAIPLAAVATLTEARGPSEIHRIGRRRVVPVTADVAGRDLGSVSTEIRRLLAGLSLPAGTTVSLGGQNEELERSHRSLRLAVVLAVFLVYLVMAAQFESFIYPLIIMFSVPLALSGAVLGLRVAGQPLSVVAVIGGIMLAGIVVNNGIVLVDRINQLRRGRELTAAVRGAARERLRPILMTTATTVLAMLPMALGLGEGAELRSPLAVTVISGLTLSTLLTLLVVPVVYTLLTPGGLDAVAVAGIGPERQPRPAVAPAGSPGEGC